MLFSPSPKRRRFQLNISERRLLLMVGDAFGVCMSVLIGLFIWSLVADKRFETQFVLPQVYWFFILTILWLLLANANDFYDLNLARSRSESLIRLAVITLQMMVVYLLVFFLSPRDALPRLFIVYFGLSAFLLIGLWRIANPALIGWAAAPTRLLIVGTDSSAVTIIETMKRTANQTFQVLGVIGSDAEVGGEIAGIPVIGTGADLFNYVVRDSIHELIITDVPDVTDELFRGVMEAYERGVILTPMPIVYERLTGRVPVRHVRNNWALVLPISGHSAFSVANVSKRALDIGLGFIGFIGFIVTLPIIGLIIRLDSPGNIFFTQIRMGQNGRAFRMVKYRTMVQHAEAKTGAVFSREGDPRVTRIGRFMRKSRLDEIPQVINVLRGEMSMVGPRPERPEHVKRLTEKIPFYRTRLVVRPGVTGWAQVRYDYGSDDEDALVKLEYDLYYIRNQSFVLDLNIIIRTVHKVFKMAGV